LASQLKKQANNIGAAITVLPSPDSGPASTTEPQDGPSLDVLLDVAKRTMDSHNSHIATLDSKAGFVFGSASLLLAGIAAFQKGAFDTIANLSKNGTPVDWWI
jgi:hypothetical protein